MREYLKVYSSVEIELCKRVLKPNGTLWVSGTYHSIYSCGFAMLLLDYHILNDISWFKPNASPNLSCKYFTASHESLIWARKNKMAKHYFNYEAMKDGDFPKDFIKKPHTQMRSVWAISTPQSNEKIFGKHPTQKPLALLERISSKMCRVNKTISRAQVQNILKNTFYIGYFTQKGKVYKHPYPLFIDKELFQLVQDTMAGRKRAPSKLYYGDKQYIFTGLVRCGCCGSLMTCETKVKDDKHSYNYLKCNKLRSKCSQKPINEAKILQKLEQELSLPINISDTMLNNIKAEVKKQLKAENINTTNLKRDITIKLNELDEEAKNLFRGYMKGKCDEKMYNELKTEIEMEKEKLQKDMDKYLEIDAETDEILANIAEIAANVGKFLKSPIISEKRDILKLILSDCKTEGKNIAFSIVKSFDELLKTPETDKWCRWQESDLRPRHYQ